MPETGDDRKRFAAVAIFVKASQDVEKPLVTVLPAFGGRLPRGERGRTRDAASFKIEQIQFAMLRISNHTACRFTEKARFFRSLWAGRPCAAASRFTFFKVETL